MQCSGTREMLGFIFSTKHNNLNKTPILIPTFLKLLIKVELKKKKISDAKKSLKNSVKFHQYQNTNFENQLEKKCIFENN